MLDIIIRYKKISDKAKKTLEKVNLLHKHFNEMVNRVSVYNKKQEEFIYGKGKCNTSTGIIIRRRRT